MNPWEVFSRQSHAVYKLSYLLSTPFSQESPLHMAVRVKDPVALELLMLAGADISLQNIGGWTALQVGI